MDFAFTVNVGVERSEGKFAAREEIEEQIQEALEGADPGEYEGANGGRYETTDWAVNTVAVVHGKAKAVSVAQAQPAGAPPSPRLSRLISDWLKLKDRPEDVIYQQNLEDTIEEICAAFPKVAVQAQLLIDEDNKRAAKLQRPLAPE